jgi:hypothetical protein
VLARLQHSHLEPLLDQPYDAPIRHAVLDTMARFSSRG